jgi:hypothetical protein
MNGRVLNAPVLNYGIVMDYKVVFTTMGTTLCHFGPYVLVPYHCISLKILLWHGMHMISYIFAPKDISSKWEHHKPWKFSF